MTTERFDTVVIETTARLAAERALQARAERLTFFDRLSESIRSLSSPEEIMAVTARLLGQQLKASVLLPAASRGISRNGTCVISVIWFRFIASTSG